MEDIIRALGEIGDDRAVELLVIILEKHGSTPVRSEAAIALGKIRGKKAVDALKSRLDQEKEDSVKAAISKALKRSPRRPRPRGYLYHLRHLDDQASEGCLRFS